MILKPLENPAYGLFMGMVDRRKIPDEVTEMAAPDCIMMVSQALLL